MRRSLRWGIGICAAVLMITSGGTAQASQPWIISFDGPHSIVTPLVAGKHCYVCCVKQDNTCTKWCEIWCDDIIVKNLSGKSVYVDRRTGKPVWLKGTSPPSRQ